MPKTLPYLASYKNVGKLFEGIQSAKIPDTFTQGFLADTLGLKASTDRPLITLLKAMGFLDGSNKPTEQYKLIKNHTTAKQAIADGVKTAYAPLFESNERADALNNDEVKGLIAQVAGTDDKMTERIAYTFNALKQSADFSKAGSIVAKTKTQEKSAPEGGADDGKGKESTNGRPHPEFHYNIQVHLPSNATEETYLNIFNALRRSFE